jgi:two-component system, LytTR family, response regulator
MTTIRTLIVDDMPLTRELLKNYLAEEKEFEIVGECGDGIEAIAAIKSLNPDLIFLDVQMPVAGGFEVIDRVGAEQMPVVIFVTAFDEFALQAFEACALDYLLKPFKKERLLKALKRAKTEIGIKHRGALDKRLRELLTEVSKESKYLRRIIVKINEQTTLLQTDEIDWIGAAGNYLELHAGSETYLIRESMGALEQKLNPETFARIHRSTIVNLDRIKTFHHMFHGDYLVVLNDKTELSMSRTYYEKFIRLLKNG